MEIEYRRLRPSDSPLLKEITTLRFLKKFVMPTFDHYSDPLIPSYIYANIRKKWRSTLMTIFSYAGCSRPASR